MTKHTVAKHLKVTDNSTKLRDRIFFQINRALSKLDLADNPLTLTDFISNYLSPENKEIWGAFKKELEFDIPKPDTIRKDSKKLIDKIKAAINWAPMYDWRKITIDQFVAAICPYNQEELIDRNHITSTYEIYIVITALTVDKIGVEYYDITPEKSFTTDLGIDS